MSEIKYELQTIGQLLINSGLMVPIFQREYSWRADDEVEQLFKDFQRAVDKNLPTYFLSTVVLVNEKPGSLVVVDGQQRLATTAMMLAAIRDILFAAGGADRNLANTIQQRYLYSQDERTESPASNLTLNLKDREFFTNAILRDPSDPVRKEEWKKVEDTTVISNANLAAAFRHILSRFDDLMKSLPTSSRKDRLKDWIEFIRHKAQMLVLLADSKANAFKMFETTNARGLKVSEFDLVKNLVFGISDNKLPVVQSKWEAMRTNLESLGIEENAIDFLRIVTSVTDGLTKKDEIYRRVEEKVTSQNAAVEFVTQLEEFSRDYVAMLSPDHSKWNDYPQTIRNSLRTIDLLDVEQIRYLMLAVTHHFSPKEATKAFNLFVNWIVRFFIAGPQQVGRLDKTYADLAHAIHTSHKITTAEQAAEEVMPKLANNEVFIKAFSIVSVSKIKLARYYLSSIERTLMGEQNPELVPNEDTSQVNCEHVIPQNYSAHWGRLDPEIAKQLYNRLGNLALISAKKNSKIGDLGFAEKKPFFKESSFLTTVQISKYKEWGLKEINERQEELAKYAAKTWPLIVK